MKEKRKGPIGRAAGLAEGMANTMRRMQRDREPRVLLYDSTGLRAPAPAERAGHQSVIAVAERMVRLVEDAES